MNFKLFLLLLISGSLWVTDCWATASRKAFVFYAVHRDSTVVAVQSNPITMADDSGSSTYVLDLLEVRDAPGGGGSPVSGFQWENGTTHGGISSEGRIRASNVVEAVWGANATLYARFELGDGSGGILDTWETPVFLRTFEHLEFYFLRKGSSESQTIPGALPSSSPDYDYTNITWSGTPMSGLDGATVSFNHADSGRTTDIAITGTPVSGWNQEGAPFQLTITTSDPTTPANDCVAWFQGLSWDGMDTPIASAQPRVTLRELRTGGKALTGFNWFRGQVDSDTTFDATLPGTAVAELVFQGGDHAGETVSLDGDGRLTSLGFDPTTLGPFDVKVRLTSPANKYRQGWSEVVPLTLREFDIDYHSEYDWLIPYEADHAMVPDAEHTLAVDDGSAFDWSDFVDVFGSGSNLYVASAIWDSSGILLNWPLNGTVKGDEGTIDVRLTVPDSGLPWVQAQVSVLIDGDEENDGIADSIDNCPLTPNPGQLDTDGDGQGDACDADDDNDGVADDIDNCPLTPNPGELDTDGDGQGDACDADDDNDGVADGNDTATTDPDVCTDSDGDSCDDCSVGTDNFGPLADNDPANDGIDSDGDGLCNRGDHDDGDDDGDGVPDAQDNCPLKPNQDQNDKDGDGVGDACEEENLTCFPVKSPDGNVVIICF